MGVVVITEAVVAARVCLVAEPEGQEIITTKISHPETVVAVVVRVTTWR